MKNTRRSTVLGLAVLLTGLAASDVPAQDTGNIATVSFGVGLNTATPNNPPNHHVLPQTIRIKAGGVVNFVVAGFHQIFVYEPGIGLNNINLAVPGARAPFIDDAANTYYRGIDPAGGPLMTPATISPSNAINRVESVVFTEPGTYLVICNVRTHFRDGMYAWVVVSAGNDPKSNQ
jgi:plastocyanin